MIIPLRLAKKSSTADRCGCASRRTAAVWLVATLVAVSPGLRAFAAAAADTVADPDKALHFWAVNEGGARIYRPDASACARIRGFSAQYAEAVSARYQVPAYTLKLAAVLAPEGTQPCRVQIDAPSGAYECQLGSVMRTFGGSYLAHTYAQRDDGSVHYVTAACRSAK